MGTYASLSEVCELLNHEIFYSVELPNEEFAVVSVRPGEGGVRALRERC